jgi:hypothetical protein
MTYIYGSNLESGVLNLSIIEDLKMVIGEALIKR